MESIWMEQEKEKMPRFHELEKDIRTQVLIIGGGMTGLLCAYFLQQAGVDYCLLEKNTICSGITGNTTAKITSQQGLVYDKMIQKEGFEKASLFYRANGMAVKRFKGMGWLIDCDMEEKDLCVYLKEGKNGREKLEREQRALERFGAETKILEHPGLPFQTAGALCVPGQYQFHPLKFAAAIAKNLQIYENSEVREMTEYFALTRKGSVAAEKVIIATHFPFINTRGNYYLKLYQERAFVQALRGVPQMEAMYVDGEKGGLSFRSNQDLLLVGGGSHRTGKLAGCECASAKEGENGSGPLSRFREEVREIYPSAEIAAEWAAQDCMSLDGMPYIGPYSKNTPELFVGTGYNKWGMTGSMLSAMILSDLVCEKENEFAALFSPGRNIIKPQLALNIWESMKGILRPTVKNRCSHMGCVLQWNAEEKTWECPCHGSRFDGDGKLLDNPAVDGLKQK